MAQDTQESLDSASDTTRDPELAIRKAAEANEGYAKVIEIKNLVKMYRSVTAVNDIDLTVYEGEIFGFLGPNGAGKTTTIKILLGLIFPTSGEALVLGKDPGDIEVKAKISYLPESPYFYEHMSAREVVRYYGSLFGLSGSARDKRVDYLLDLVGLQADSKKPLRAFSKGMLQRVGIAQSLINDPKILFFDEPTSGLDPIAHRDIRNLILHLKGEGRTIFLSSHQLSDVELVCDRVSILNKGKLRRLGTVEELIAGANVEIVAENIESDNTELPKLRAMTSNIEFIGTKTVITASADTKSKNAVLDWVRANKGDVLSVAQTRRTLEDIFFETVRENDGGSGATYQAGKTTTSN